MADIENSVLTALREKAAALSLSPGVYMMKDKRSNIIYIGKAKALKKRVSSYFKINANHMPKTEKMVSLVRDFSTIVTTTEAEALLLECSLIKQHKPKYNILLKDDRGYNYIKISPPPYSRITPEFSTEGEGEFFGPYHSGFYTRKLTEEINLIFKLPTCTRVFPRDFRKQRPCLNHHLNRCMAVCTGNISQREYAEIIDEARLYIKDGGVQLVDRFQQRMEEASNRMDFETAAKYRDRLKAINTVKEQAVIGLSVKNADFIGTAAMGGKACFAVIKVRGGRITDKQELIINADVISGELISEFLLQYYMENKDVPKLICAPDSDDNEIIACLLQERLGRKQEITKAKRGERYMVQSIAMKNAAEEVSRLLGSGEREVEGLSQIGALLGLSKTPQRIESIDISNYGEQTVLGGLVVFKNGKMSRKDYRKFIIKTVKGVDDPASIAEVLGRRFQRYVDGDKKFMPLPDLILLDGGKTQLGAALKVRDSFGLDIPICGMVKDQKHRTRGLICESGEISIDMRSRGFWFLNIVQNEVHRYSVLNMQKSHFKTTVSLELLDIEGVGKARAVKLLKVFKNISNIKKASVDELCKKGGLPVATAQNVYNYYSKNDTEVEK